MNNSNIKKCLKMLNEDNAIVITAQKYKKISVNEYEPYLFWQTEKIKKYVAIVRTENHLQLCTFNDDSDWELMYHSYKDGLDGLNDLIDIDQELPIFVKYGKVLYNAGEV